MPLLQRYRDELCCFNDDIQGTAAVALGTLLAACKTRGEPLTAMNIVIVGAGSAGCGIAERIVSQMVADGVNDERARRQVYMVDRFGLVTESTPELRDFQAALAMSDADLSAWSIAGEFPSLLEVVEHAKPAVLIGVSGKAGLFTEAVIRGMHQASQRPIVFPLSNPSRQVEATPAQVMAWTDGDAIIATGSPFEPVEYDGRRYPIAQCNNSYISGGGPGGSGGCRETRKRGHVNGRERGAGAGIARGPGSRRGVAAAANRTGLAQQGDRVRGGQMRTGRGSRPGD